MCKLRSMHTLDDYFARGEEALAAERLPATPAALATEIDMSEASLSRIRRGKQNITRDVILRIIDATGGYVTADGLLGLHGRRDTPEWPVASAGNGGDISGPDTTGAGEADSPRPFQEGSASGPT